MNISRIVKTGIILTAMLSVGITSYAAPTETKVDSPSNIRDYEGDWQRKPPFPVEGDNNTVTTARADGYTEQSLYLWDKDNVPARTNYTTNNGSYYDDPDFVPYVTSMLVPEDVKPKGAVLLCAGGAFAFRGDYTDTVPTAEEMNKLGYQCFIVDYRLHPYTQEEGALDLQRAVRFVRKNADIYRIDPDNIVVAGFSAGGIQAGEQAMNFKGSVNGTALDSSYIPDELDEINADVAAVGVIYSFYGRLSVAELDVDTLRNANLPPTYVCYGTNEVFRSQIERHITALREAGVTVGVNMLEGYSHGFGANGNWCPDFDEFLMSVFPKEELPLPELETDEPVVEGRSIKFSVNTNADNMYLIAALYDENGTLYAVRADKSEGEFENLPDGSYKMKIFAWEKGTMKPLTKCVSFDDLKIERRELTEYLNNTLDTADGTLHYTYYLPSDYDGGKAYPMLMTLPGWSDRFNTITITPLTDNAYAKSNAEVWTELNGDMIVVSPNLTDWGDKSARQTIELADWFIENYNVDTSRIYAAGFSAGGETLSRVVDMRPELFAAYLHCATQWDGGYDAVAEHKMPVYISMAEHDEYYGSDTARRAYEGLKSAYERIGITGGELDNLLVLDIKPDDYFPAGTSSYHGGGWYIAHDRDIIRWMIEHKRA